MTVEARKHFRWRREEVREPQGEEVGAVAGRGEDVTRDLEVAIADLDKDLGFEELLRQSRYCAELVLHCSITLEPT